MKLVLLGPPGAGKGTQCKRIVDRFQLVHLSSGDIFRSEIASGSDLGIKAKSFMDAGELVPDEVVISMMVAAIAKAGGNCVLDGFPRTVVQAGELDKALAERNDKIDAVVNLVVDDDDVASRLTQRRSCPKCGEVYHLEYKKPASEDICDFDGEKLVQREDDKPNVVINRLNTYHQLTEPLVEYYNSQNSVLLDVDASKSIDDVTDEILTKLEEIAAK